MSDRIRTFDGEEWHVVSKTSDGHPRQVEHTEPYMRGSMLEAFMNAGLAVRTLKSALRESLPAWMRRHVPEPRIWWTDR